jgi:hypothetical protein
MFQTEAGFPLSSKPKNGFPFKPPTLFGGRQNPFDLRQTGFWLTSYFTFSFWLSF